jgi:SNF2 family DNA or RNA helicase
MKEYRSMERKAFMQIGEEGIDAFGAAQRTLKCLQMASGAVYANKEDEDGVRVKNPPWLEAHKKKLEALDDIIEEAAGKNLLVAYYFRSDLERLQKRYKKARVIKTQRDEDDWNAGKIQLGLVQPASIGHGVNLQDGGHVLVFFSLDWNLEYHDQVIERIGPVRQLQSGYNRPVYIHYIVANGTIDHDVLFRLRTKASVQDTLKKAMKR